MVPRRDDGPESFPEIEHALRWHPDVRDCAVIRVTADSYDDVVAYVETSGLASPLELRSFLVSSRRRSGSMHVRLPDAVVILDALPRSPAGGIDLEALPRPALRTPPVYRGKASSRTYWGKAATSRPDWQSLSRWPTEEGGCLRALLPVLAFMLATAGTNTFWPGSTDLSGVPKPWAWLFMGLYGAEALSFAIGVAFLFSGRRAMARFQRAPGWTWAARMAIVWLLVAWWPQDNFYRLAAKTDWPRQAALVYGFNITLMAAAATLVAFAVLAPPATGAVRQRRGSST